jgi:hypothetical protein
LLRLAELELIERERRMVERRIKEARFPTVKSLDASGRGVGPEGQAAVCLQNREASGYVSVDIAELRRGRRRQAGTDREAAQSTCAAAGPHRRRNCGCGPVKDNNPSAGWRALIERRSHAGYGHADGCAFCYA